MFPRSGLLIANLTFRKHANIAQGAPYSQELPANDFLQDGVWPSSTFNVGPDQPDPRPNPYPNPEPLEGSRSARAVARVARLRRVLWWRFSKKSRVVENPVSTNKTSVPQVPSTYFEVVIWSCYSCIVVLLALLEPHSRVEDKLTLIPSNLSPKRDCGSKNRARHSAGILPNGLGRRYPLSVHTI